MNDIQALIDSRQYIDPSLLGSGATASVFKARNAKTGRWVAVKILHPSLTQESSNVERFKQEIQIARLVHHPGMVPVYNMMRIRGRVCLEMELLHGTTLAEYLFLKDRLSVKASLKVVLQLASILNACHKKNIVHRDLKPHNVFVQKDGTIRLLDFGIAKMTMLTDLTKTGVSLGTPEYMAPELFSGSTTDPRADVYSLGVLAYELIAGRPPFQGDSIAELFHEHLRTPVPDIRDFNPNTPRWVIDAIHKLLEKNPVNRYQCMDEFLLDLSHQNVASRAIPGLKKIPCIHCGQETIKHLPFCVLCGFGFSQSARNGRFRVTRNVQLRNFRAPDSEKQELRQFILNTFDVDMKKVPAGRKVLLTGVDKMFAELVQKQGEKYNQIFQVKKITWLGDALSEIFRSMAVIPIFFILIYILNFLFINIYHDNIFDIRRYHFEIFLILSALTAGGFTLLSALVINRTSLQPILKPRDLFSTAFFHDLQWLHEMSHRLQRPRTGEMRQVVAKTFEHFLLIREQTKDLPGQELEMDHMQRLLLISVKVANLVSEVDRNLAQIDWAGLNVEYLNAKAQGGDMFYMELLQQYETLQGKRDALATRFNELRAYLNRLCARTMVEKQAFEESALDKYEKGLQSLEGELALLAEVRMEVHALQ